MAPKNEREMPRHEVANCMRCGGEFFTRRPAEQCSDCDDRDTEEREVWASICAVQGPERADGGLVAYRIRFPYPPAGTNPEEG
jgi:hypothetical protein